MLEERNHRRRHRHHLPRRHIHVIHRGGIDEFHLGVLPAHRDSRGQEAALGVQRFVRLGHHVPVLLVGGEVIDLVGDPAVHHPPVGGLDETERVDPRVHRQVPHQADVRPLRRLDRAHPAVVAVVHVADLQAGPFAREPARPERGQPPLVGQARQRVALVHELRQLRGAEELLHRRDHRPDVHQRLRRDRLDVLGGHALPHHPFHPGQTHADLVLDQLTHGAHPAVTEMVDVVDLHRHLDPAGRDHRLVTGVQAHQVLDGGRDVVLGEYPRCPRSAQPELLVDLVTAHPRQVVALLGEEQIRQQVLRRLLGRRLAGTQLAMDLEQRVVGARHVVLGQRGHDQRGEPESLGDPLRTPAQRLEQHRHRLTALAVDAHAQGVALVDVELQPGTARRDHPRTVHVLLRTLVDRVVEVHTRRAHQL
ncbi:hypothetical protein CJ469_06020 [Nocardia farcinica]|nr:hypothetical protein CJ469_06020 [Nocardia farcinica]PFX04312.1 hypothetical protein CJ468_05636 [Nocardia farcinica]